MCGKNHWRGLFDLIKAKRRRRSNEKGTRKRMRLSIPIFPKMGIILKCICISVMHTIAYSVRIAEWWCIHVISSFHFMDWRKEKKTQMPYANSVFASNAVFCFDILYLSKARQIHVKYSRDKYIISRDTRRSSHIVVVAVVVRIQSNRLSPVLESTNFAFTVYICSMWELEPIQIIILLTFSVQQFCQDFSSLWPCRLYHKHLPIRVNKSKQK